MDRYTKLSLDDDKVLNDLGYCFTSKLRRKIIAEVSENSCTVMELAMKFNVPISTMSTNLKILHDAGLILLTPNPKKRGNEKIVSLATTFLHIDLSSRPAVETRRRLFNIPLGSYSRFEVEKPCGIANENGLILEDDKPDVFYSPSRVHAQIIWFTSGYLEYEVPNYLFQNKTVRSIQLSLELCSECPNYKNDWKSEISFSLNGTEIATYLSPGDFGGRQGKFTPNYWSKTATQFGLLKSIRIDEEGTFIDEQRVSDVALTDIDLFRERVFTFRIGVKKDAKYCGGINIFGRKFGDYPQDINVLVEVS